VGEEGWQLDGDRAQILNLAANLIHHPASRMGSGSWPNKLIHLPGKLAGVG
jgi:hypothetical protein